MQISLSLSGERRPSARSFRAVCDVVKVWALWQTYSMTPTTGRVHVRCGTDEGLATFVSNTVVKKTGVKDEGKRARDWPKGGVVVTSSHNSHSRADSVAIAVRGSGRVPPLGGMGISKEMFIPPSSQGRLLPKFPIVHPKVHTYTKGS